MFGFPPTISTGFLIDNICINFMTECKTRVPSGFIRRGLIKNSIFIIVIALKYLKCKIPASFWHFNHRKWWQKWQNMQNNIIWQYIPRRQSRLLLNLHIFHCLYCYIYNSKRSKVTNFVKQTSDRHFILICILLYDITRNNSKKAPYPTLSSGACNNSDNYALTFIFMQIKSTMKLD